MEYNNEKLLNIKKEKIILYLTKVVAELNHSCNNIITKEKFQRAVIMFTNLNEDYETIKKIIDWHVENEKKQYAERLNRKRFFTRIYGRKNKCIKTNNIKLGTR